MSATSSRSFLQLLGPGILFAASAVGVSHVVQSTRAGANYGLALAGVIVISCVLKYPAFRFGNEYAAATGLTLIDSYRRQGWWAVILAALTTLLPGVIGGAALALVTAGVIKAVLGIAATPIQIANVLFMACASLLLIGKYRWFERLTKLLVVAFTLAVVVATVLTLPAVEWGTLGGIPLTTMDLTTVMFVVALAGWMPAPLEASILQSLWTGAKAKDQGRLPTIQEARLDFNVGFTCALTLALCFLILGAGLMHSRGIQFQGSAGAFAGQVIGLFTETIGEWSRPIIGIGATAAMLSTLLTVLDGYPRLAQAIAAVATPGGKVDVGRQGPIYLVTLLVYCVSGIALLNFFMTSFKAFIDLTASIAFCTAPIISFLNHRAMFGEEVSEALRPAPWLRRLSLSGIAFMSVFALVYLYLLFAY